MFLMFMDIYGTLLYHETKKHPCRNLNGNNQHDFHVQTSHEAKINEFMDEHNNIANLIYYFQLQLYLSNYGMSCLKKIMQHGESQCLIILCST